MKMTPLLILLLLLLGGAGMFFVWDGEDELAIAPIEIGMLLGEPDESAAAVDLSASPTGVAASDAEEAGVPEGLESVMREEVAGDAGDARTLVLQVWDGKQGVPAGETDVFFLDGFAGPELKDLFAQHWSDLAATRGQRFKTDARGRVVLPSVAKWAMVTALGPGSYGFAKIGRRHREVETVTLQRDETVTVHVVDGEDRSVANVPVGVVQRVPVRTFPKQFADLMAQMKQLEQRAVRVKQFIAQNPAQRAAAEPRMNSIRAQQGRVKIAMAVLKGSRGGGGNRRGKARGKNRKPKRPAAGAKPAQAVVTTRAELRAQRRTDANGVAAFRHFQIYRRGGEGWWPAQHVDQFEAVLLMPLQQPETAPFVGRPVPAATLQLRLPKTGSIALRMVDRDGRPFTHPVRADLRVRDPNAVPWSRLRERKEQNETEIAFPFVGLGLEFTALCRLDDNDFRWNVAPFMGPSQPDERMTIDVVVAPGDGMLFGRLVDGAGKPLAGLRPSFLINSSAGRLEGEDVTTDKDGRFHLPYQVRDHHRPPFHLEIRRNDVRPVAGLAMDLPQLPEDRVTDLGDLQLDAYGAIARGVVVDDVGQPIPGARVQLQRERDLDGKKPRRAFVDEAFVAVRADKGGRYELFGELEPGRYRLTARAYNHFPFESDLLRPGDELDLKLLRNSKVVGTVLSPPWVSSRSLRVVLQSAVDSNQRRRDRVHDYKGKKYVYLDRVRPGLYNLLIRLQGFPDPILRVDDFQVAPGQQDVHPRLQNLDLVALLNRYVIAAVDGQGRPVKPNWPLVASVVRPDGQSSLVGFSWKGTKLTIISASSQLEVWPRASGYRAERTTLGPGASELRFLKYPSVAVHLPGLRGLVGDAMVWIKLQAVGGAAGRPQKLATWDGPSNRMGRKFFGLQMRQAGTLLGPGDSVQIPSLADGRYKVIAYLLATGKKRKGRPIPVELGAVDVRLVLGAGPQRLTVAIAVDAVRKGFAALVQREAAAGGGK